MAKRHHQQRQNAHHQRHQRQGETQATVQQIARHRSADKVSDTEAEQYQRNPFDTGLRDGLKERPQVGKEGEMAAENQDRRQHAAQHTGTAQHPEQRGEGPDALRAHGRQHPQLPEQRQQAGYRTENKHVAPADQLPEVAAERRGHHRGDRHRGKDDRQRLWHMGRRHQTHRRGGGHRPEAADGDPQQQTAQQEKRQRIGKSDHQAGDYLQYGKEHQHPAAIDIAGGGGDQQAGN